MTDKAKKDRRTGTPKIVPSFRMEADGRGNFISVTFTGILSVKELSDNEIAISTKREFIELSGKKLSITVFENKTVEISGNVESIKFSIKPRGRSKK